MKDQILTEGLKVGKMSKSSASAVARYFLFRANFDGDTITPLRIQKLVYYAYVWTLVVMGERLFPDQLEAWPNGPVVPTLYHELKHYGASAIDENYVKINSEEEFDSFLADNFDDDTINVLDDVYSKYMTKTPFELVLLTHSEAPWIKAQKRSLSGENNQILDEDITAYYSPLA